MWEAGVHCQFTPEVATAPGGKGTKRGTREIVGLSKLKVEHGALADVLGALEGSLPETFKGASVVFADFDIVLQLGAEDYTTVAAAAYGPLQRIPGIVRTNTAFADTRRYDD